MKNTLKEMGLIIEKDDIYDVVFQCPFNLKVDLEKFPFLLKTLIFLEKNGTFLKKSIKALLIN